MRSNVRKLRVKAGLSQDRLAADAGISRNSIIGVQEGLDTTTLDTAVRVALALGCSVVELFPALSLRPHHPMRTQYRKRKSSRVGGGR